MQNMNKILIIGGDSRQQYMADYFENNGFNVSVYGLPEIKRKCVKDIKTEIGHSDIIILPLPVTKDNKFINSQIPIRETMDDIFSCLNKNHYVFAGMIGKGTEAKMLKKTDKIYDYFKREDLTIKNTIPTVQGILKTIIDNIEYTVHSSKIAVFGYGRVAKVTADNLFSLGAEVTVCVRKKADIAAAEIKGLKGCMITEFHNISHGFDIIINTVPSLVINREILMNLKTDSLIIDVASAPYGTDFTAAFELGLNTIQCPSLPGKVAPKTAGKIIADEIMCILKEEDHG